MKISYRECVIVNKLSCNVLSVAKFEFLFIINEIITAGIEPSAFKLWQSVSIGLMNRIKRLGDSIMTVLFSLAGVSVCLRFQRQIASSTSFIDGTLANGFLFLARFCFGRWLANKYLSPMNVSTQVYFEFRLNFFRLIEYSYETWCASEILISF